MNIPRYLTALTIGISAFNFSLFAQTASTDPVGYATLDIAANGYTFIGTPFVNQLSFSGVPSTVSGSSITFAANSFSANEFDQVSIGSDNVPQYILEVTSGSDVGASIPILSNTSDTLVMSEDVSAFIFTDTNIAVRALHTLDSLFPSGAPLTSGSSAATADEVLIFDAATQTSQSYFYYSFFGTEEWRSGSVANGLRPILPNQSIYINRKSSATSVTFSGLVKTGTSAIDIIPGFNLIPNPYPVAYTLDASNLFTGDPSTGLASGSSPAIADELIIYDSNAVATTYFYYSFFGTEEWRTGSTPAGNVEIPAGGAIMINRKASQGAFSWVIPQPF